MNFMRLPFLSSIALAATIAAPAHAAPPRFSVSVTVSSSAYAGPLTGRLVLVIARAAQPEPRLLISPRGPAMFAIDVSALAPGKPAIIDERALGYPRSLAELPPGDYYAQAVVNVYEQVHRDDGKTIWVHMNDGRVEFFSNAAGNLYSDVTPVHVGGNGVVSLRVTHVIPEPPPLEETE